MNVHSEDKQVTIKVLRVGSKQFTQTLLKQLPVYDPYKFHNNTISLAEGVELWGYVRESYPNGNYSDISIFTINDVLCRTKYTPIEAIKTFNMSQLFIGV